MRGGIGELRASECTKPSGIDVGGIQEVAQLSHIARGLYWLERSQARQVLLFDNLRIPKAVF